MGFKQQGVVLPTPGVGKFLSAYHGGVIMGLTTNKEMSIFGDPKENRNGGGNSPFEGRL